MAKTRKDFHSDIPPWLIEDWFPTGHRGMDTAPEGSFKTMLGCWISACISSGMPVFGHHAQQGNVLIVDEETPEASLNNHLDRFSKGLGLDFKELPIYILSMDGFRFGRKTELDKLIRVIKAIDPVFIRFDSLLAMLPGGRQSLNENDCHLGETIRDDMNRIKSVAPNCSILLAAHSKKFVGELHYTEVSQYTMQNLVRGHGSIVGEGCDTGFIVSKISEHPNPTRFCMIVKPRRQAIPGGSSIRYFELEEEEYGKGWARFKEISEIDLPPSEFAKIVYPVFLDRDKSGGFTNHKAEAILKTCAFLTKSQCREGVKELLRRRVIVPGSKSQTFLINPIDECEAHYLDTLKNSGKGCV